MIDENINEDLEAQDLSQDVLAVDAANQVLFDDEKPRKKRKSRWGGVTGGENVGRLDYKYEDIVDFEKQLQELRTQLKSGTIKFEDLSEKEQEGLKVLDQHLKLKEVVVKPNAKKNLIQDLISSYTPSNIIDELTKPLDFDGKDNSTFSILDYFTEGKLYAPQEQEVVSDGGIFYDPETNTYRKKTLDIGFIEPTLVTDVKTIAKLNTKYNRQASVSPDAQVYASENGRQYVIEGEYWKVKEPKNSFYYYVTDPNLIGKLNTKFGQNLSAPDKTKTKDLALYNTLDRNFANDTYSTFNSSDDINQWVYGGGFGAARFENKIKEFEKKYNIRVEKSKPTLDRFTYGITDALNLTDRTITIVSPNGDRKEFFIDSDGFLDDVQGFVMAKAKPSFNKEYKSKPSKTRSETLGGVLSTVGDLLKENALSIFETGELPQRGLKKEGVTPDYRSVQPTDALYVKPQLPIMFDDDVLGLITPKEYFSSDLIGRKIKQKEEDKKILKQTANQYAQAATNPTLSKFSNIYKTEEFTPGAKTRYIANRLKKESEIIKSQIEDFKKEEEDVSAKLDRIENMKKFIAEQKLAQVEFQNLIDQGKIDPEVAKQRLEERKDFFQRAYGHIDKKYLEEFQVQLADFVKKSEDMSSIADPISSILSNSEKAIGIEMMQRKDQGSFFGGVLKSIVDGALSSLDFGMRVAGVDSENSKKFVDGISSDLLGEGVTKEYEEDANYFYKGVTALTKSMAASATGGRFFGLFGMGYTEMSDQLAPIEGISDEEKIIYSALYGTVSMILEEKGLEEIFKGELGNKVSNYIIKNTISGLGKNATKEVVDAAIINNTKLFLIEMGIKAGVATGSETLTEVAQLTAEYGTKWTINKLHGTDFFNGQLNWQNYAKDLKETVLTTLTGTGAVSIISQSPSVINRGMNALNTKEEREALVAAARATGMDELVVANLRAGLLSGKYSKENAQSILDNFKIVQQKVNTIPKEIPIQEQAVALDLIIERDALNSQIEGVDPALAAPSIERVKEINETLKQIGYAVQESSTESVLQRQQEGTGETGGGREGMEQVVQGEEVTREGKTKAVQEEVVIDKPTIQSNSKTEVDRVKSLSNDAEDGATFNLDGTKYEGQGLIVPVVSKNTTAEELTPEMISDFVEEHKDKIGDNETVKVGIYKFPNSNQVSIDLNILAPESAREQAIEFGKNADQESLFDLSTFENVKTGGTGLNPVQFNNEQFREISKAFKEGRVPDVFAQQPVTQIEEVTITPETTQTVTERINNETDAKKKKVFIAVQKVLSAIPNARIILHENTDSFVDGVAKSANTTKEDAKNQGANTFRGAYVNGDVHINLETAGVTTVFHEAFHDLLAKKGMDNNALLDMAKGLKSVISDKALKQRLDEFISNYEEGDRAEEYTAELGAIMAEAQKELSTTKFQQFKTLVNKIAKKLGLPVVFSAASTAQDAVDFMNSMSSKLGRGEQIEVGKKVGKKVGNTGIKAQGVTIMKGEESMEKYGLKKGKNVTRKIGEALESRQRAKYGKIDQKDNSPEARKKISNWMVDEVKYFIDLMGDKSGKGWYGELYQKSLDAMGKVFPEMKNDQNARDLFTMLVAITSDGQKVMSNFKLAAFAYDYYKKNGSMPKTLPGQRVASFESNLKRINDLLNKYNGDIATIKKDLMEVKSIKEINKERKKEGLEPLSTNWPVSFKAPFAASVFGPKLGMFYSNLSGNEAYPTLDRWWSRTFNRYRGTLIPSLKGGFDKKGEALGLDRFKKILGNPDMSNEEALLASKSYRDSYAAKGYKNGTEIEKAANTIYKIAFENLNDAPFTKNDRQFMYDTVSDAVNKLNKQGYDLSIADVQAILWYFEKNLYKTLGVQAKIEGISYEDAANYTYDKWIESGKKFDYNIKDTEEGQAVEDEDINDNKDQISKIKAQKTEPVAGNKLFNEPLKDAETIAKSYMKSVGMEYVPVEKITKLYENLSKRISDAYDKMKNDPNDPQVKKAYEAMAKETLDQYDQILEKGYNVEINNNEPYSSSEDMINDLRDNKRMKIFSTESGFGDEPITEEQRKENPLLRDSGRKDINGETLLVNDVFRFVHDFFGHAKLGNSFGPIGEENAWRVHSEMYSPEARKAMTSETRGQNSWVNFSGVNDAVFKKRDKARELRKQGKVEEADNMVIEVYEEMKFADQKVGLLPDFAFEEGRPSKIKAQKLAPNGKPSNLNDVQWEQVRTPAFKKWFGDWENDPANSSKVVDENGEPLVVYHGSVSTDIDEFDRLKSKRISSGLKEFGTYFTDNIKLAKAYASWAKLNKDEEINIDREINKWKEVRDKARNNKDFESAEYAISMLNESKKGKIYPVFLNLRNIKSFDAKGETNIEAWNNLEVKASYKLAKNRDAMDFLKEGKFGVEKVDGIKAENIVDAFVQDEDIKKDLLGNVYLVFDGNTSAIKSATENVGTFSAKTANIKAQKQSKEDAIQDAKDKYELSVEKRGNSHQQGVTAAIADLQKSDWYAKADDTQRENAVREIKKFFGEKLKAAPSVAKITGKTKDTAVVSDLAAAIRDQIKLEAKAAREATKDINQRRKELGIAIKNVIKNYKGKISEKQLSAINDRISKVNLLNEEMVDRVIDYVDKVMKDADYKEKINKAKSARATIKKLKKDSNRQAEVRAMATAFASIDPDLVEDIDEYMAIAEQVKNALKPTSLSISNTTKFSDIYSYVDQYLEGQENIKKERLLSNNPSLVEQGIIDKSMSLKDIESKIRRINEQKNKLNKATNSEELKDNLKGEINSLKDILKAMVFGYNPITNERVEMTDRIKQVIKEISSLDVDDMTTEQMIALVESLNNFVKNGTIGGLDAAHKTYVGIKNANDLKRKGFVARQLKAYFSPMLGRLLGFEGMSLNELFTRLFGGVTRGNEFMEKSGVAGVVMGVNKAKKMSNAYQELYANTFKNIKGFFDQENVYERGVLAFVSRTNSIKPEEANKEFNRRIDLLLESYESLKNGTAEEQKMAEVYKKVFDRLNIESRDMSVIESNAKQFNIAGAAWWMGTWENHYQDLYDVSLSIYNTDLGSDFYYTSDRLSKLSESTGESIDITNISERGSSFLINTENEEITDKSKAGVLIASTYPKTLKDKGRYVNLNFDINQSQALSGALVDIETAGAIRQVDAFISSDSFKSIIPSSSDRSLVVNRINKYIRRSKNKLLVPKDYARVIDKVINEAGRFGTTMALGGVFQFILQTFSVGINTLIQAGKNTQLYTGKSFNDWMNSTGTPTANRGVESVTSIENKMNAIDPVKSTLQQVARQYQKLTQFYMKTFLSKPDVFVARAAWKSYYLKYLSDNGYDTKKINWDTWNDTIKEEGIQDLHEKAMLFAENMVSRQQNVSDERLAGETFSSEDGLRKAVRKILLPFAGFSVNQRMRLANDIITLTSARNVASKEDIEIAGRSLAGTVAEQATFNFIKFQVGKLIYYGAMSILGYGDDDEDEEEAKKRNINALKYPIKSFIGDMASPAPFLDDFVVWAVDKGIKPFMEPSDSEINDAVNEENNIRINALGKYKMTEDEKEEFIKKYKEDNTFSLESFKNDTGKYGLISVGSDAYEALYESLKMNDGKYTEEFQGKETEKYLTKDQIESQKIFSALKLFHFIGALPREVNQLADKGTRKIKQNSLTKNQYKSYKEFTKVFKREPKPYEIDIIKSTNYEIKEGYEEGSNTQMLIIIGDIDYLGGFSNQQGKVYSKLFEETRLQLTPAVYELIQKGKTAEQIKKIISN